MQECTKGRQSNSHLSRRMAIVMSSQPVRSLFSFPHRRVFILNSSSANIYPAAPEDCYFVIDRIFVVLYRPAELK